MADTGVCNFVEAAKRFLAEVILLLLPQRRVPL